MHDVRQGRFGLPFGRFAIRFLSSFLLATSLLVSSCGGGGGGGGGTVNTPPPAPPEDPPPAVASIEISPASVLLGEVGGTHQLTAQAFDDTGAPIDADVTWSSSNELAVTIDDNGMVTSQDSAGSSSIIAMAGGVSSAPAMAIATLPVINHVLVSDDQIVGQPALVDPSAAFELGVLYTVSLTGVAAPAIGDVVLASEEKQVAGRVVDAVEENDGTVTVTLEVVGFDELFTELVVDEVIELKKEHIEILDGVDTYFDVEQLEDGSYSFTLRPETLEASLKDSNSLQAASSQALLPNLGPFDCTGSVSIPLRLASASFRLNPSLNFQFQYDSNAGGLQKLAVIGAIEGRATLEFGITVAIDAKIECSADLFDIPVPFATGALAIVASPKTTLGFGMSIGGKINWTEITFPIEGRVEPSIELGLACPAGILSCEFIREQNVDYDIDFGTEFTVDPPDTADIEPRIAAFLKAKAKIGPVWLPRVGFEFLELKGGVLQAWDLDTVYDQVTESKLAKYDLSLEGSIGLGQDVDRLLNFFRISLLKPQVKLFDVPLQTSPTATSFTVDNQAPVLGDMVNFQLDLDNVYYPMPFMPPGGYNVEEISLWLVEDPANPVPTRIADTTATQNQTAFTIPWTVTDTTGDIYAFADTVFIPSLFPDLYKHTGLGKVSLVSTCPQTVDPFPNSSGNAYVGEASGQLDPDDASTVFTDFDFAVNLFWDGSSLSGMVDIRDPAGGGNPLRADVIGGTFDSASGQIAFTAEIWDGTGNLADGSDFRTLLVDILGTDQITFEGELMVTCATVEGQTAVVPSFNGTHSLNDGPWFGINDQFVTSD